MCFLRIKRKLEDCNLTVDDQFIRQKFLQALPPTTRVALSAHQNLPLEDFAKLADTIFQYSTIDYQVAAVRNDDNTKIKLCSSNIRLPQKTPLYHSLTDKSQKFVDSTCSTHNTQNDANHGVSGLVKSLRQSILLQDHQRQHTKGQTKNLQRGRSSITSRSLLRQSHAVMMNMMLRPRLNCYCKSGLPDMAPQRECSQIMHRTSLRKFPWNL